MDGEPELESNRGGVGEGEGSPLLRGADGLGVAHAAPFA